MERRNFFKFFPTLLVAPLAMVKAIASKSKSRIWFDKGISRGDNTSCAWWTQYADLESIEISPESIGLKVIEKDTAYGTIRIVKHPLFAAEKYFMSTPGHRTVATLRRPMVMWSDNRQHLAKENKA